MKALLNCDIYTGTTVEYDKAILVNSGKIESLIPHSEIPGNIETIDLQGLNIAPGFIDIQVNGGGGVLFNDAPTIEGIDTLVKSHRKFGTTDMLPTFITGSTEGMRKAGNAVNQYLAENREGILGIHFEGPFLAESKAGVHDKNYIRPIANAELQIIRSIKNGVTLLTVAPENVSSSQTKQLVDDGIVVSIGHTNASYEEAMASVKAGASCFTHLYNAMSALSSRSPGVVGAALDSENTFMGIIIDGLHVSWPAARIAIKAKGSKHTLLVTDAMPPVGDPEKKGFRLGEYDIRVENGKCITGNGILAGSALDMATAVRNCIQQLAIPKDEALRMASTYPAQFLGKNNELGFIQAGYKANLVIFNNQIEVQSTFVNGEHYE